MSSSEMPKNYKRLELVKPTEHGYYEVISKSGMIDIAYFGNGGFMNEPDSFFNPRKFKANEIHGWIETWYEV